MLLSRCRCGGSHSLGRCSVQFPMGGEPVSMDRLLERPSAIRFLVGQNERLFPQPILAETNPGALRRR